VVGCPQDSVAAVGDVSDFPDEAVNQEDHVNPTHQVALHNAVARDLRCRVHTITLRGGGETASGHWGQGVVSPCRRWHPGCGEDCAQ